MSSADFLRPEQPVETPLLAGLARNALSQLVARLLSGLALAVALVIVARDLGPADYGLYALILTLTLLVGTLADWGLLLIGTRVASTRPEEAEDLLGQVLGLRLALGAVGIVVLIGLAFASTDSSLVRTGALIAGASLLPQAWFAVAQIQAQVDLRLERIAIATLISSLVTLGWIVTVTAFGGGILVLWGGLIASALVNAVVAGALTPGGLRHRPRFHMPAWRRLLRESTPLGVAGAFVTIYFYIDVAILARLATSEQVGLYDSAYRFVQFGLFLPTILVSSVYGLASRLADQDRPRFVALVRELLTVTALVAPLPVLMLSVVPGDLLGLVYTEEFTAAATTLALLGGALALMTFAGVIAPLLVALHRERVTLKIGAVAVIVNVATNLVLIPALAAEGAALATLVTELVVLVPSAVILRRETGKGLVSLGHLVRVGASIAGAVAVVLLIPGGVTVRLAVGLAAYLILLVLTRAAGRELIELTRTVRRAPVETATR